MPEGQVSHHNAAVITAAIAGAPITLVEAPEPRLAPQRIAERLAGDVLDVMEAHGKHHLFRFRSGRVLHSHLQMQGKWRRFPPGADIPRAGLWLAIHTEQGTVAQYRGPVLRLYEPGAPLPRIAALGPDLLAPDADPGAIAQRLRALAPHRQVGDAIMDQRVMAGIGNVYKSESLFLAGVDPWRAVHTLSEDEAQDITAIAATLLAKGVRDRARIVTFPLPREMWAGVRLSKAVERVGRTGPPGTWVYARARKRCRACGTPIRARGQGDANRTTYWCPACQG